MSRLNLFKTVSMTLVAAAVCLSVQAQATTLTTTLNFGAPTQSLWGPGSSISSINHTGNLTIDWPYDAGTSTFGYSVSADTGTVFGNVNGSVVTNYAPVMSAPRLTMIALQYVGVSDGSLISTLLGASATVKVFGQTLGQGFTLATSSVFTPAPSPGSLPEGLGFAVDDIIHQGLDVHVANVGVDLAAVQTVTFRPIGVEGTLYYQREGRGLVHHAHFNLTSKGMILPVNLSEAGTYDFWFGDNWILQNWFSTSTSLDVSAYASAAGANWSANIDAAPLYVTDPFALDFNAMARNTAFTIKVEGVRAVPVPRSLGLVMLGGGILLLGVIDRRRRGARLPDDTAV